MAKSMNGPDAARAANSARKASTKVRVSQGTIDAIKGMGMKKALNMLPDYNHKLVRNLPGNKEFVEGVRRLYGENRFKAAMGTSSAASKSASGYKSADSARSAATAAAKAPAKKVTTVRDTRPGATGGTVSVPTPKTAAQKAKEVAAAKASVKQGKKTTSKVADWRY